MIQLDNMVYQPFIKFLIGVLIMNYLSLISSLATTITCIGHYKKWFVPSEFSKYLVIATISICYSVFGYGLYLGLDVGFAAESAFEIVQYASILLALVLPLHNMLKRRCLI